MSAPNATDPDRIVAELWTIVDESKEAFADKDLNPSALGQRLSALKMIWEIGGKSDDLDGEAPGEQETLDWIAGILSSESVNDRS